MSYKTASDKPAYKSIYREDVALITLDIPGDNSHRVNVQVLLATVASAMKSAPIINGGRTVIRVDGDGRVFLNERLVFTPKALQMAEQLELEML